ncbi:MAG: response regulator [Pyrinomonadaceae bacterium]
MFGKDQESRLLFKCTLEIWDFDTAEAGTIEESIWIAEKRSPDLVLMDTELIFSNSLSEMRQMRDCSGLLRMAPFILLSGHAQKSFRRLAFIAGATDFIKKPVDFKLLETILKTRLTDAGQKNNLRGFQ